MPVSLSQTMETVTITHRWSHLLAPVGDIMARATTGDWALAAELCAEHLTDPERCGAELNALAQSVGIGPDGGSDRLDVHLHFPDDTTGQYSISFTGDPGLLTASLDLFSRVLIGQWSEVSWHGRVRQVIADDAGTKVTYFDDFELNRLRCLALTPPERGQSDLRWRTADGETYRDLDGRPLRRLPDYPNSSNGIAEGPLPARLAYHAYKHLTGKPDDPTFSLPEGPLQLARCDAR